MVLLVWGQPAPQVRWPGRLGCPGAAGVAPARMKYPADAVAARPPIGRRSGVAWEAPPSIECAYSWWLTLLVLVIASISFGAVTAVPVLLKPLRHEWHTGAAAIGWVHMSTMIGAGLGSLVLGRLLDRRGFFPIALTGAAATALGLFLASRATSLLELHLACGVLIGGIGQGAFFSPMAVALSQWFDRHRALAIALATCGQGIGGLTVPPLLRLGAERIGWRSTLELYAGLSLVVLVPCVLAFRRAPPSVAPVPAVPSSENAADAVDSHRRRRFWTLGLGLALFNLSTFSAIGHLTAYGEERGFSPVAAAGLTSVLLGATLVPRLMTGTLVRRAGAYRMLLMASVLSVGGLFGLSVSQGFGMTATAAALIGLGFGGYLPAYAILVRDMFPAAEAGRRVTEIYFFGFFASGVGSGVGGLLRDRGGSYAITFQCAAWIACSGLLILLARRKLLGGRSRAGSPP